MGGSAIMVTVSPAASAILRQGDAGVSRLRVCLVTDCYQPSVGGIENHVYCLARELAHSGHSVDVVTHRAVPTDGRRPTLTLELPPGARLRRIEGLVLSHGGADPLADPRIFSRMEGLLARESYDVVHGHSFASLMVLAALRAATRLGVPALLTKHSMTVRAHRPKAFNRLAVALEERIAARWTNGLICLSDAARDEMAGAAVPVYLVHGGVDHDRWRPDAAARARVRASLGYQAGDIVIGYLGRMVASKGVLSLVEAAAPLLLADPRLRLLLVGDGPARPQVESRVAELGLAQRSVFLGSVPWTDTPDYLNAMDMFAFPSFTEAFGLVLLEAMACGLPVVARLNAGSGEILAHGQAGYLIRSDGELRSRLAEVAQDSGLRRRLGGEARQLARSQFGWPEIAARLERVYRETISIHHPYPISREGMPEPGPHRAGSSG